MKKLIPLCALFCLLCVGQVAAQQVLPNVKVENAKGELISTTAVLQGKPAIISFWGVTCKPCLTELNAINEVMEDWKKEADFQVIAVSIDDSRFTSRARSMAKGYNWQFTCLFDKNQDLKRAMNVNLTPQVFVVDGKGNVVYSHTGYVPGNEEELFEKIKEISAR